MNTKVEILEKNVIQLEIELDADKFEEGMQRSFFKNAKRFNVPGFRKGKAPRKIVEKYFGEESLYEDAMNFLCPDAYDIAVSENNLHPVDRPEIDVKQIGSGRTLIFTAKVTIKPEVKIEGYKGIGVEKLIVAVSDEDLESEFMKVLEKNARTITVEDRGIQNEDIVTLDFIGAIDGKPFQGGEAADYVLNVGSGMFIPGFEEQVVGMKKGEEKQFAVTFPEDYFHKEIAGKESLFNVTIKEIKVKELPAADDEFAKDISEFDTLDAYKADLRKKLEDAAAHEAEHRAEDELIDKLLEKSEADIPQIMIEKRVDGYIRDFEIRLNMQYGGISLEKFLEITKTDMSMFRKRYEAMAERSVRMQLVVEKIAELENIKCDDEEVEAEMLKMAEDYKQSTDEFKKHLSEEDIEYIKKTIINRKTVDFLVENADMKNKTVTREELSTVEEEV